MYAIYGNIYHQYIWYMVYGILILCDISVYKYYHIYQYINAYIPYMDPMGMKLLWFDDIRSDRFFEYV